MTIYGTTGEVGGHLYSSPSHPPAHEHSEIYFQVYIEMTTSYFDP